METTETTIRNLFTIEADKKVQSGVMPQDNIKNITNIWLGLRGHTYKYNIIFYIKYIGGLPRDKKCTHILTLGEVAVQSIDQKINWSR